VTLEIESTKLEDTLLAGVKLGALLKGGEVIQLIGDLGAGKTSFVKGLADGLESEDEVASPSFTISRQYNCRDDIILHHLDFYRLSEPGIMKAELQETIDDPKAIVVIEWSDIVQDVLPLSTIKVSLQAGETEESRKIRISMPKESPE